MICVFGRFLSIEIGSQNIKIVECERKGKNIIIHKSVMVRTPRNSINDGIIINIISIKEVIKKVLHDKKIKCKSVIFTSRSTSIITRIITIPFSKQSEMQSIVKYQMQHYLPINFDEYIVEFVLLEKFNQEDVQKARVRVVVYPKDMAEKYLELAKTLKLTPVCLDINYNCITKLLCNNFSKNTEGQFKNETFATIDMGSDFLEFAVILNGKVEFTRIISSGGSYIDGDISRQIGLHIEDAEIRKIENCDLSIEQYDDGNKEFINNIIKSIVDDWIREIKKFVDYYNNNNKNNNIKSIYIYGGSSKLKGIDVYMANLLNIPVSVLNNIDNINFKEHNLKHSIFYLNNIGSFIRL